MCEITLSPSWKLCLKERIELEAEGDLHPDLQKSLKFK